MGSIRADLSHLRSCAGKRKVVSFIYRKLPYKVEAQCLTQATKTGTFILIAWVIEGAAEPGWKSFRFYDIRELGETPVSVVPRAIPSLTAIGNLEVFTPIVRGVL